MLNPRVAMSTPTTSRLSFNESDSLLSPKSIRNTNNNNDDDVTYEIDRNEDNKQRVCIVNASGKRVCFVTGESEPRECTSNDELSEVGLEEALEMVDKADNLGNVETNTLRRHPSRNDNRRRSTLGNIGHSVATGARKIPKKVWVGLLVTKVLAVVGLLSYYYVTLASSWKGEDGLPNPSSVLGESE